MDGRAVAEILIILALTGFASEACRASEAVLPVPRASAPPEEAAAPRLQDPAPPAAATAPSPARVDPVIRALVERMTAAGISRDNARERGAASHSTSRLKVDERGYVQVYLKLRTVDQAALDRLRSESVEIEVLSAKLAIVQAWVPFDAIDGVAKLDFVERVEPPSYAAVKR